MSIPCSTWSVARYSHPEAAPILRDIDHPLGIPDENGVIPAAAAKANAILEF